MTKAVVQYLKFEQPMNKRFFNLLNFISEKKNLENTQSSTLFMRFISDHFRQVICYAFQLRKVLKKYYSYLTEIRNSPTYNDIEKVSKLSQTQQIIARILVKISSIICRPKLSNNTDNITPNYQTIASPQLFGNSSWLLKMRQ